MSNDEDDFEELCKSLEEKSSADSSSAADTTGERTVLERADDNDNTVVGQDASATPQKAAAAEPRGEKSKNGDNELDFIDKYLLESVDLREEMFSENANIKASTPLGKKTPSEKPEILKKCDEHLSKLENTFKFSATETSQLLAGNFFGFDMSILDGDDWEEDDIKELTLDQYVGLLDSDDEDEVDKDDDEDICNKTVIERDTTVVPQLPKKPPVETKKKSVEKVAEIRERYYKELSLVYRKYNIAPVPGRDEVQPRVFTFKTAGGGKGISYDSLEEYIDNHHPLWRDLRSEFNRFLSVKAQENSMALTASREKAGRILAKFVRRQWKSGYRIDLNKNLSCFPVTNRRLLNVTIEENKQTSQGKSSGKERSTEDRGKIHSQLNQMLEGAELQAEELHEREETRYRLYQQYKQNLEDTMETAETTEDPSSGCGLCHGACICEPLAASSSSSSGQKRKQHDSTDPHAPPAKREKHDIFARFSFILKLMDKAGGRNNKLNFLGSVVRSVVEADSLRACYGPPAQQYSRDMVQELVSVEDIQQDFDQYYYSPYEGSKWDGGIGAGVGKSETPEEPSSKQTQFDQASWEDY